MPYGILKQNLSVGTWVRIGNTTSPELDGMIARVGGKATNDDVVDAYNLILTKKLSYSDAVVLTITEACIHELDKTELRMLLGNGWATDSPNILDNLWKVSRSAS